MSGECEWEGEGEHTRVGPSGAGAGVGGTMEILTDWRVGRRGGVRRAATACTLVRVVRAGSVESRVVVCRRGCSRSRGTDTATEGRLATRRLPPGSEIEMAMRRGEAGRAWDGWSPARSERQVKSNRWTGHPLKWADRIMRKLDSTLGLVVCSHVAPACPRSCAVSPCTHASLGPVQATRTPSLPCSHEITLSPLQNQCIFPSNVRRGAADYAYWNLPAEPTRPGPQSTHH